MYRRSVISRCASASATPTSTSAAPASKAVPNHGGGGVFATQTMGNPRRLMEYYTHTKWCTRVTAIKNYKIKQKVNFLMRILDQIPWSAVLVFFLMMFFFGVDVGAGIMWTADTAVESREKDNADAKKRLEGKQWSMDQIKAFEDGGAPSPSWAEGGPRSK